MSYAVDTLVLVPDDIDLARSPLLGHLGEETYVLGAFNPGMTRLPNGNLLLMVRVAEALRTPIREMYLHDVVFLTDIAEHGDQYIVASGEADLACRITPIPKNVFAGPPAGVA